MFRLLTAGDILQMWRYKDAVRFNIGESQDSSATWHCIWRVRPASPVVFLAFSADGTLFATSGKNDRLVRIWYQNQQLLLPNQTMDQVNTATSVTYSFIYIAHPRPVSGFSWRATSRYMPRGAVANVLVTNCRDNICRIWSETLLPDDGLICMQQLDPAAAQDPHFRAHRQKQRFIQRLKHVRQSFTARKMSKAAGASEISGVQDPIPTLPSTYSIHDFHNFSFQGTGISPGLHFHLSAAINGLTDIPLVPAMTSTEDGVVCHKFVLHWLNNKEMFFSLEAGKILRDLATLALKREDSGVEQEMAEEAPAPTVRSEKMFKDTSSVSEVQSGSGGMSHAPSITRFVVVGMFNLTLIFSFSASTQTSASPALCPDTSCLSARLWTRRLSLSCGSGTTAQTSSSLSTQWTAPCWFGWSTFSTNISRENSDKLR